MSKNNAPFILKISFKQPGGDNGHKNAAHIRYIGTRSGVVMETSQKELIEPGSSEQYVQYIDERPNSHGLFGQDSDKIPDPTEVQNELKNHDGIVWRMVLSLREDDAIRLGYTDRADWETMLRATVIDAAGKMGIGATNVRWVAAFHQEQGHPHVHLVLWEKNAQRERGVLSKGEHKDVKRIFVNEIYGEERLLLTQEKTQVRDYLRELSKDTMGDMVKLLRELKLGEEDLELELKAIGDFDIGISPKIQNDQAKYLISKINKLSKMLPDSGRIAYKLMPNEVKAELKDISRWFLEQPHFKPSFEKYLKSVENLTRQYTFKQEDIDKAIEKATEDLVVRLSQVVLKGTVESTKVNLYKVVPDRAKKAVTAFSNAKGKLDSNYSEEVIKEVSALLQKAEIGEQDQKQIFTSWEKYAQLNVSEEKISKILIDAQKISNDIEPLDSQKVEGLLKVLRLSGVQSEEIENKLLRLLPEEERKLIVDNADTFFKVKTDVFISQKDWDNLSKELNIKLNYPWVEKELERFLGDRDSIMNLFKKASSLNKEENGWAAFTMNVSLKSMNVPDGKRREVIQEWADKNNVRVDPEIFEKIEAQETKPLKKATWEKLCNQIGIEQEYPWFSEVEKVLDRDSFENEFTKLNLKLDIEKELSSSDIETIGKMFRTQYPDKDEFKGKFNEWLKLNTSLDEKQRQELSLKLEKRSNDIEITGKELNVKDPYLILVNRFAKVLTATDVGQDKVFDVISSWNQRTNAGVSEERIQKIVEYADKQYREMKHWDREIPLSKQDFEELCKDLNVKAPYLWKRESERASMSLVKKLWNNMWNEMEKEKTQSQAKAKVRAREALRENAKRNNRRVEQEEYEM